MKNKFGFNLVSFYISRTKIKQNGLCPVFARITINGERANFRIQRDIHPDDWDPDASKMIGRSTEAKIFNEYLKAISVKANVKYNELMKVQSDVSPQNLRDAILNIKSSKSLMLMDIWQDHIDDLKQLVGKENSKATVQKYTTCMNHFKDFLKKRYRANDIPIKQLNYTMINKFSIYLKTDKQLAHNTTVKFMQNFKKIINLSIKNGWLVKDPFVGIKLSVKEVARPYLTEDELNKLIHTDVKIERLEKIRDFFVFSCFTGLSYIDVYKLMRKEIEHINGTYWIKTQRMKTKTSSNIPLLPVPYSIIQKYNKLEELRPNDRVLPIPSNQKTNAYLKEIADLCEIEKPLSFHVARHTFATTVTLMNGVPIESVSRMLGHTNIKTTQHYARIVDKKVEEDMVVLNSRLGNRYATTG